MERQNSAVVRNHRPSEPLFHLTRRVSVPFWQSWLIRIAAFVAGMLVCGIVAYFLLDKLHAKPQRFGEFYECFWKGAFGTALKRSKYIKDVAILLCISLAMTPAFRMRFWNIGAEGQTLVSILSCIGVAFYLHDQVPEWLLLVLMFIAAVLAGAIWALIPALFKAFWGTNETLFTLMMNYVATFLVGYFLIIWVPSGSSALGKLPYGALPIIFGQKYLLIIIVVVVITVLLYFYLNHSKHGYEISVVGGSENTARYIGINVKKVIIRTMLLSGVLCGIAGYLIGAGLDQSVNETSVGGQGFTGIMVAWLAKFNPLGMALTAALIQLLSKGSAQIVTAFNVPSAIADVIVGIVLFFIIGSEFFINYKVNFRGHTAKEALK